MTIAKAAYGVDRIERSLRVSAIPYLYDIAKDHIPDHASWSMMGYNAALTTTQETLWPNSSEYAFPTAKGQLEVVSSDNTQDKANGTGALTVEVNYLRDDYSEGSVTLTMNGTAAVATGASHADIWRVNSFHVKTTGTNLAPVGNLTLRGASGGATYGYIPAGKTRARTAVYTVPLGKTLYITSFGASAVGIKYVLFTLHANCDPDTLALLQRGLFFPLAEVALMDTAYNKLLDIPLRLPATTDFKVSATAEAAAIGTCHLRGWLEG